MQLVGPQLWMSGWLLTSWWLVKALTLLLVFGWRMGSAPGRRTPLLTAIMQAMTPMRMKRVFRIGEEG